MLITTTPSIESRPVRHILGLVHSETILGAHRFRDLLARLRDIVGGRARAYEATLIRAREMAMEGLERRARLLGADAVAGIHLDVEVLGQAGGMVMVCAMGTAVELMPPDTIPPSPPIFPRT